MLLSLSIVLQATDLKILVFLLPLLNFFPTRYSISVSDRAIFFVLLFLSWLVSRSWISRVQRLVWLYTILRKVMINCHSPKKNNFWLLPALFTTFAQSYNSIRNSRKITESNYNWFMTISLLHYEKEQERVEILCHQS